MNHKWICERVEPERFAEYRCEVCGKKFTEEFKLFRKVGRMTVGVRPKKGCLGRQKK